MRLFFNRLYLSSKRSFLNPYIYGMAFILIALAIVAVAMPSHKASAYIPVAILNLDDDEDTARAVEDLCEMGSIFDFYEVDSEVQMYSDLATGRANTGFILPEDLMAKSAKLHRMPDIRVITTPSSTLPFMSSEEVFMKLFPHFALRVMTNVIDNSDVAMPADYVDGLSDVFDSYLEGNAIYRLEALESIEYNEITTSQKIAIPVYKFAGFFLWMAALLGALSYLNDCDNKLYMRMSKGERFFMGLILPAAHVIPVILISLISFLICGVEFSVLHLLGYSVVVILVAFVIASIIAALPLYGKKSGIFAAVLPTYLILSFLFGGVLMNLSVYSPILRTVSMLFPPYFF